MAITKLIFLISFSGAPNQSNINLDNRLPGQKTPTSQSSDSRFSSSTPGSATNHFPIPSSPHTPSGTPNPGNFYKLTIFIIKSCS